MQDRVQPIRELILAMALCHSVVPEPKDIDNNDSDAKSEGSNAKKSRRKRRNNKLKSAANSVSKANGERNDNGVAVEVEVRHEGALCAQVPTIHTRLDGRSKAGASTHAAHSVNSV